MQKCFSVYGDPCIIRYGSCGGSGGMGGGGALGPPVGLPRQTCPPPFQNQNTLLGVGLKTAKKINIL